MVTKAQTKYFFYDDQVVSICMCLGVLRNNDIISEHDYVQIKTLLRQRLEQTRIRLIKTEE